MFFGHAACPGGTKPSGGNSVGFFCWQQVGIERLAANGGASNPTDPSLNVDPSRNGVQPDIAFTGMGDTVAWVVWYETGKSDSGSTPTEALFAAKLFGNSEADGGFQWQAVGSGTTGLSETLDNAGPNHFGACSASKAAEAHCSLNKIASEDAQDPRVAAGTPRAGFADGPVGGLVGGRGRDAQIFVAHLVAGDHFELFNGQPVSNITRNASLPDITFLGNEPVISGTRPSRADTDGRSSGTSRAAPHRRRSCRRADGVPVPGTSTAANVVNFRPSDASRRGGPGHR